MVTPLPAASIMTPMMLLALTRRPLRSRFTSHLKRVAVCVSLAEALACRPSLLTIGSLQGDTIQSLIAVAGFPQVSTSRPSGRRVETISEEESNQDLWDLWLTSCSCQHQQAGRATTSDDQYNIYRSIPISSSTFSDSFPSIADYPHYAQLRGQI